MRVQFTKEELAIAKSVDLCAVASHLGFTVKPIGRYHTLKEMDSIRIYNKKNWFRWSRQFDKGDNGGSQIDFLRVFAGLEVKEAVFWLLDFAGYKSLEINEKRYALRYQIKEKPETKKDFILPQAAPSNEYLYSYLCNRRMINKSVVDYFINKNLIYEAKAYHNIVFKGKDKDGKTRFASMRGVFDKGGKGFRCDVSGSDKSYGFNDINKASEKVLVFEAAIDLMSYVEIFKDFSTNKLALGMLYDGPLETFLLENPHIKKIKLCLDNDKAGRKTSRFLLDKYRQKGYETEESILKKDYKDYNDWLKREKEESLKLNKSAIAFNTQSTKVL